jgi:hypothetical protein
VTDSVFQRGRALLRTRRVAALVSLVAAVVVVHGCVVGRLAGYATALQQAQAEPAPTRMQALYVRSMEPLTPVLPAAAELALAPSKAVASTAPAASSPAKFSHADVVAETQTDVPADGGDGPPAFLDPNMPPDEAASQASAPASASTSASASSSTAGGSSPGTGTGGPYQWPESTRVSFELTGNYRGPVSGSAQVEWVHDGGRYQVHLDVRVGLSVAPFMSRTMSSEGLITAQGLKPYRYDQLTKLPFREPSRSTLFIDADGVRLSNGTRRDALPGLQDTASQFVQLSWLLSTQAALSSPGGIIEVPLAMPRSVESFSYDVLGLEKLATPFGELEVLHVKPRREAVAGGDMTIEMWLAPQYRYLPMRVVIRQDAETFVDLMITKPPEV